MADFISQDYFHEGMPAIPDGIAHETFAKSVASYIPAMPMGCAVALQGTWGRGKTDILARVAAATYSKEKCPEGIARNAIWINPWRYGTTDLLSPLVIQLIGRLPKGLITSSSGLALREAAETVVLGGISFGMKAASTFVAGAGLLGELEPHVSKVLGGLVKTAKKDSQSQKGRQPDRDPVDAMAVRFRELVEKVLSEVAASNRERLLICVDDLDRCLPDRQIAFLEAIRFLIASDARATFLIALDPTLVRSALAAHYQTQDFDPDRYLEKMFDLRLTLPAVSPPDLAKIFMCVLRDEVVVDGKTIAKEELLKWLFGDQMGAVVSNLSVWLSVPDLRNPRILSRIVRRLELLARSRGPGHPINFTNQDEIGLFIAWLGIAERWPQIRLAAQDAGDQFVKRFALIRGYYITRDGSARETTMQQASDDGSAGVIGTLPKYDSSPQLVQHLRAIGKFNGDAGGVFYEHDKILLKAGL